MQTKREILADNPIHFRGKQARSKNQKKKKKKLQKKQNTFVLAINYFHVHTDFKVKFHGFVNEQKTRVGPRSLINAKMQGRMCCFSPYDVSIELSRPDTITVLL